jgi:DNA replication protein DnaC
MSHADIISPFDGIAFDATAEVDMDVRAAEFLDGAIRKSRTDYFTANCPPQYRHFDIEHAGIQRNRPQLERVLDWRFGPRGLLAAGPTNQGKTRAMFALCKRLLCEEAIDVGIWHAQDFFSALQGEVRFGRDDAEGFIKRVAARRVLFIDDYGQQAVQANREEWARGWFFRLLDLRVSAGLPLLVTTNLRAEQLAADPSDLKGDPLVRRLLDLAEPVKFSA